MKTKVVLWLRSSSYPALIIMLGLFAYIAYYASAGISNPDTFFHLRVGQEILSGNWRPWGSGHFGSLDNGEWASTQWLSQVILAAIYNLGGFKLLAIFALFSYLLLACGIYYIIRSYTSPVIASFLTFVFFVAHLSTLSLRPQLISFFLILLTVHIFLQASKRGKIPWILLLIFWLWPNFHGMWIAGLFNVGVLTIAHMAQSGFKENLKWIFLPFLSFVATFFTFAGPKILESVIFITNLATQGGWDEWAPPNYMDPRYFIAFLVFLATVGLLSRRSAPLVHVALLLAALFWALYSQRSAPFALLMVLPLLAGALTPVLPARKTTREFASIGALGLIIALILVLQFARLAPENLPVDNAGRQQLAALPPGTVVFTGFMEGAYALQAEPELNIFVHGYADAFNESEIRRIYDVATLSSAWQEQLKATGARYALLPVESPQADALISEDWLVVETGATSAFLKAPANWNSSSR